jgi:hypothetical protein
MSSMWRWLILARTRKWTGTWPEWCCRKQGDTTRERIFRRGSYGTNRRMSREAGASQVTEKQCEGGRTERNRVASSQAPSSWRRARTPTVKGEHEHDISERP